MERDILTMTQPTDPHVTRRAFGAVVADLLCVALFVLIGRHSHSEADSADGVLTTAWPFLVGVIGGYIGIAMTRWPALSAPGLGVIVVKTVIVGMALRYGVQHNGAPLSFVIVTAIVLTAFMGAWRIAFYALHRQAQRRSAAGSPTVIQLPSDGVNEIQFGSSGAPKRIPSSHEKLH
jgi:peptidoglycan/LPS O-acetylase OafA/YrhL